MIWRILQQDRDEGWHRTTSFECEKAARENAQWMDCPTRVVEEEDEA